MKNAITVDCFDTSKDPGPVEMIESLNFIGQILYALRLTNEGRQFKKEVSDMIHDWPLDEAMITISRIHNEMSAAIDAANNDEGKRSDNAVHQARDRRA